MESINVGSIKINNMSDASAVNAPANQLKINNEAENTSKDTQKSTEEQAPKSKHVITYIGSSEFTDSTGHKWYKNHEQTYDDNEYNKRNDLHFMVNYGEMKHTIVTM